MRKEISIQRLVRLRSKVKFHVRFSRILQVTAVSVLLLIGLSVRLTAQENVLYEIQNYTTKDGLSNNHVYQTFQDSRGLIWLVTGEGIDLFDGSQFEQIMEWEFSSVTFQNRICFEDSEGLLWIKIVREDGVFFKWIHARTKQIVKEVPDILRECVDEYVDLAKGPDNSLLLLDKQGRLWKKIRNSEPILLFAREGTTFSFCSSIYNDSIIWLYDFFCKEKKDKHSVEFVGISWDNQVVTYTTPDPTHRPFILADGTLWTIGKVYYAKIVVGKPVVYKAIAASIPNYNVELRDDSNFSYDSKTNEIWIVNQGALKVFKADSALIYDFSAAKNINGPKVSFNIFLDNQGALWVGTIGGVFKVVRKNTKFRRLVWQATSDFGNTSEKPCRGMILHSNGTIYFNASLETYAISPQLDNLRVVSKDLIGYFALSEDLDGKLLNALSSFYELDLRSGKRVNHDLPEDLGLASIWSILPQKYQIWLGNNNGILCYDRAMNVIKRFEQYNGYESLQNSEVYQMVPFDFGRTIWMISSTGIYVVDHQKGVVGRYWNGGTGKDYLPANTIRHLSKGKTGGWWMATNKGLVFWDPVIGILQEYGEAEGLINTNIYAVYPDKFGSVWFSSDAGIGQLDYVSGKVCYYQTKDGVTHNEFNRISHLQLPDGRLLFGSMNGVTVLNPADFQDAFKESITGQLSLVGASVLSLVDKRERNLLPTIYENGKIDLYPDQVFLKLQFAVTDYLESAGISYAYQIEGVHQHWVKASGSEVQLAGLPYGTYGLKVRAKNSRGVYYDQEYTIPLLIHSPVYLQKWFLIFGLVILMLTVHLGIRFRHRYLLDRQRELEQEVKLRTIKIEQDKALIEQQALQLKQKDIQKSHFFSNLTHELRTPITLILGPIRHVLHKGGLGQENTKILTIAQRNAKQLLQLVNSALDLFSLENHSLSVHRKSVLVDALVRELVGEFRLLGSTKKISLNYHSQVSPKLELLLDEGHVRTILSNLLSNAIKYTPTKGKVSIHLEYGEGRVQLKVRDTGRGIHPEDLPYIFERFFQTQQVDAPSEGGTGIGLSLCKELVELMEGHISVESRLGEGTEFRLFFPAQVTSQGAEAVVLTSEAPTVLSVEKGKATLPAPPLFQRWRFARSYTQRPTILVAEDNLEMQQYLESVLSPTYSLHFVCNGKEALTFLKLHPQPELLITDVMMPEMDGYQLIEEVKKSPELSKIPILVLSAKSEKALTNLLVDDYLVKPFEEAELLASVRVLMERNLVRLEQVFMQGDAEWPLGVGQVTEEEQNWLLQLEKSAIEHLGNPGFTAEVFANTMYMGRTVFFQEVKRLTGMTPNQYILEVRLLEARLLLQQGTYSSFSAVVAAIGMKSESYFSQLYRDRFGVSPSVYFQNKKKG